MKYIILFLLAFNLQAFEVRQYADGYMFRWVQDGELQCWGMPDYADLNYFNASWLKVTDTAIRYNWPAMPPEQGAICDDESIPRVVQMVEDELPWLYAFDGVKLVRTMRIPGGIPCGDVVSRYYQTMFYWSSVSYSGTTGMALCY